MFVTGKALRNACDPRMFPNLTHQVGAAQTPTNAEIELRRTKSKVERHVRHDAPRQPFYRKKMCNVCDSGMLHNRTHQMGSAQFPTSPEVELCLAK